MFRSHSFSFQECGTNNCVSNSQNLQQTIRELERYKMICKQQELDLHNQEKNTDQMLNNSRSKREELQNKVKLLLTLLQRVTTENWDRFYFLSDSKSGFDSFYEGNHILIGVDNKAGIIRQSAMSKMSMIMKKLVEIQNVVSVKEDIISKLSLSLQENDDSISDSENGKRNWELMNQFMHSKTECLDLKLKLQFLEDQNKVMQSTIQNLEQVNSGLEKEHAKAEIFNILNESRENNVFSALLLSESGEVDAEMRKMNGLLKQALKRMKQYSRDVTELRHAVAQCRVESSKVITQVRCLKDIIQEKNRIIEDMKKSHAKGLNIKLMREKENNL